VVVHDLELADVAYEGGREGGEMIEGGREGGEG